MDNWIEGALNMHGWQGDREDVPNFSSPATGSTFSTEPLWRRSGPDGLARDFNEAWCRFTNRSAADSAGDRWLADVHPEDRGRCDSIHATMRAARAAYTIDYRLRGVACGYRWVMEQATPVLAADGSLGGFMHHCMDVHERVEADHRVAERLATLRSAIGRHQQFETALAREITREIGREVGVGKAHEFAHEFALEVPRERPSEREHTLSARARTSLDNMARLARGRAGLDRARMSVASWLEAAAHEARAALPARAAFVDASTNSPTSAPLNASVDASIRASIKKVSSNASIVVPPVDDGLAIEGDVPLLTSTLANLLVTAALDRRSGEAIELRVRRDGGRVHIDVPCADAGSATVLFAYSIERHGGEVSTPRGDGWIEVRLPLLRPAV